MSIYCRKWKVYDEDEKFIGTFGQIFDAISETFKEEFLKEFTKQVVDGPKPNTEPSIKSAFDLQIKFEDDCPYTPDFHKIHCGECSAHCSSHDRIDRK